MAKDKVVKAVKGVEAVKGRKADEDGTIKEFAKICDGKYRVRLIDRKKKGTAIDIREYIDEESFVGFTRRGIRIVSQKDVETLEKILSGIRLEPETPKE